MRDYQTRGGREESEPPGWKLLSLDETAGVRILDEASNAPRRSASSAGPIRFRRLDIFAGKLCNGLSGRHWIAVGLASFRQMLVWSFAWSTNALVFLSATGLP
jgi:hypothetical protein